MFRHLLVPLDGSPLAEAVLPAVRHLADKLNAEITLVHMLERKAPVVIHGQRHLGAAEDAERYLAELAHRALPELPNVRRHVHTSKINDVGRSIIAHANELQIDLIVLCTHGAGGVRHGLFGTVVQRVIALGTTPVLLVPAGGHADGRFSCSRLLVPLDGNPEHEQGLSAVADLAPSSAMNVLLLMVIPNWGNQNQSQLITSRTLPATTVELLEATRDPARAYLDSQMMHWKDSGCEVTSRVERGEPVTAIVAAARDFQADLIVLGTHGTTHLEAFWSGSVTPQLVRHSGLPLLLVPVHNP